MHTSARACAASHPSLNPPSVPQLHAMNSPFAFHMVPMTPITDSPDISTATPDPHSILPYTHPITQPLRGCTPTPQPQCEGSIWNNGHAQEGQSPSFYCHLQMINQGPHPSATGTETSHQLLYIRSQSQDLASEACPPRQTSLVSIS